MDFDSSSKFIASLAKFLQSLCNGYVDFDKGVEVIGHIYLNVDSDTGKKIDYVLNEKVCKNDNSVTFISNSFHAQPAEKPKPVEKKIDKSSEDSVILNDSGQDVPSSTNVGTTGGYQGIRGQDSNYSPGSKRPGSPLNQRNSGRGKSRFGMSPSSYQGMRSDVTQSPRTTGGQDYDNGSVFQGGGEEDESYSEHYDQKPMLDADGSVMKQEQVHDSQSSSAFSGNSRLTDPNIGRRAPQSGYQASFPQNSPSKFQSIPPSSQQQSDYVSPFDGMGEPPTLTKEQQEELEMYYRKGTDQHLTFLRNMREAHAMYPFTGKRDKELFDKALAELLRKMPLLGSSNFHFLRQTFLKNGADRIYNRIKRPRAGQFKAPGSSPRGAGQFGRQMYQGGSQSQGAFPYQNQGYPGTPGSQGSQGRRMSTAGSEAGDSFLQPPSEESFSYDDSQGMLNQGSLQGAAGDGSQQGFHGAFTQVGAPGAQGGPVSKVEPGTADGEPPDSPPDIKYEIPQVNYLKGDEFDLIEIDEDDDEI